MAAVFLDDRLASLGVRGMFIDAAGYVTQEDGKVVANLKQDKIMCMAKNSKQVFCGGFFKKIIILGGSSETIELA